MTTMSTYISSAASRPRAPQTAFGQFRQMLALRRSRKALAKADDYILKDIGVTRAAAEHEASRPFWDVPNHWRKSN